MIQLANLTTHKLNDAIDFYKERGLEVDPRPRLPIQYADPTIRLDFSQKQIRSFVEDLLLSLKEQHFDGVLVAALPDITAYTALAAQRIGLSVYMPILSRDRALLGIKEILTGGTE